MDHLHAYDSDFDLEDEGFLGNNNPLNISNPKEEEDRFHS
jgi:hypothetical protein